MIIRNASLRGREGRWDILIREGKIDKIGQNEAAEMKEKLIKSGKMRLQRWTRK